MAAASYWQTFAWTNFSKPTCDGAVYSRIKRTQPVRIVELGLRDIVRSERVIQIAQRFAPGGTENSAERQQIQYCGIDLFDARTETAAISLKEAHNRLVKTGAKIRLVPGDLASSLGRTANILSNTDLLIVDAMQSREALEAVFHFLPRMLHTSTSIARYSLESGKERVRWMKPDSFVTPVSRAA